MKLIVATHNPDKLAEIRLALDGLPIELVSIVDYPDAPEVEEDGATLEANAIKKATSAARATGLPALADDTGLEVEALGGAPGVYSARYTGEGASYEDNCRKLLAEMRDVPAARRTAIFRCVIAIVQPPLSLTLPPRGEGGPKNLLSPLGRGRGEGEGLLIVEGRCDGRITTTPRGTKGFGYDPIFEVPALGKTFAELSLEEKNRISHRGRALTELRTGFAQQAVLKESRSEEERD